MAKDEVRPTPENIGEGPEARMTNIPPPKPVPHAQEGDQLIQQPGLLKPEEADAVGEGDVEELSTQMEGEVVEELEERTQIDNAKAVPRDPPLDIRRRLDENRPPVDRTRPEGLLDTDLEP